MDEKNYNDTISIIGDLKAERPKEVFVTRRKAISAGAIGSVAVIAITSAAFSQEKVASLDAQKAAVEAKVLTPDQIVEGKVEGPVRVEFVVKSLVRYTGLSTEKEVPMSFKLQGVKAGNDQFNVEVANSVFARLRELGIDDSPEEFGKHSDVPWHRHFVGKTVRVHGTVERFPHAKGEGVLCWLRIDNLDQIESVRRQ